MPSGKTVCPHITDNKDGTITIKYQPTERGLHEMDIKYDGNHIPGQRHNTLEGYEVAFPFENNHDLFTGVKPSYTCKQNKLDVSYRHNSIHSSGSNYCLPMIIFPIGSPLQFYVDAVNSGVVTAYGPGLSYGMVNKAATFTVVTKNAGEGKIAFFSSVI